MLLAVLAGTSSAQLSTGFYSWKQQGSESAWKQQDEAIDRTGRAASVSVHGRRLAADNDETRG